VSTPFTTRLVPPDDPAPPGPEPSPPGVPVVLPRARALTEAVLAPTAPALPAAALDRIRRTVTAALVSETAGGGVALDLGDYQIDVARLDPSRCRPPEPFTPSPGRCRRAIGLEAVRRALRLRSSPVLAVEEILGETRSEGADDRGGSGWWWGRWYRGLSAGARAVVQAEAVSWATALWTALEWHRFDRLDVGGRTLRWTAPAAGGSVSLRARVDVRTWAGDGPVLVLVGSGLVPASWRPTLGYPALVAALAHDQRAVPRRVVMWWPAAGQVRIAEVDAALLEETAAAVTSAVMVWRAVTGA
jgi:hypothetical protein